MADLIMQRGYHIYGIFDNNPMKWGSEYRGIPILKPNEISRHENAIVLIDIRFYEAMRSQLRTLGFDGPVIRMIDYNSFSEYSLSDETVARKRMRLGHGIDIIKSLDEKYGRLFYVFCPFPALGDVYFTMSYLEYFLKKRDISKDNVCVLMSFYAGIDVVRLFDKEIYTEVLNQDDLEAAIQAAIYSDEYRFFIAHQDRPYVVKLQKILDTKCIPLDLIYRCGVFGLPKDTIPKIPVNWDNYPYLSSIEADNTVIISPYAKSVPTMDEKFWAGIVEELQNMGKKLYTNVAGDEKPLSGTEPIRVRLCEKKSLLEKAGTFIGVRSGLCDIIRSVNCKKIALYPDYYYMGTRWKAIDMYSIDSFTNIEVTEDIDVKSLIAEQL
ncbi:MAG: hypothetical protein PUG04_04810 [Lachnospiraceae bacterium]|nr:hypothetical protein [Lachnospiraceae bacterium]